MYLPSRLSSGLPSRIRAVWNEDCVSKSSVRRARIGSSETSIALRLGDQISQSFEVRLQFVQLLQGATLERDQSRSHAKVHRIIHSHCTLGWWRRRWLISTVRHQRKLTAYLFRRKYFLAAPTFTRSSLITTAPLPAPRTTLIRLVVLSRLPLAERGHWLLLAIRSAPRDTRRVGFLDPSGVSQPL